MTIFPWNHLQLYTATQYSRPPLLSPQRYCEQKTNDFACVWTRKFSFKALDRSSGERREYPLLDVSKNYVGTHYVCVTVTRLSHALFRSFKANPFYFLIRHCRKKKYYTQIFVPSSYFSIHFQWHYLTHFCCSRSACVFVCTSVGCIWWWCQNSFEYQESEIYVVKQNKNEQRLINTHNENTADELIQVALLACRYAQHKLECFKVSHISYMKNKCYNIYANWIPCDLSR